MNNEPNDDVAVTIEVRSGTAPPKVVGMRMRATDWQRLRPEELWQRYFLPSLVALRED